MKIDASERWGFDSSSKFLKGTSDKVSRVTDGGHGCQVRPLPLGKLNVKTGPPFSLYFGILYYFGFK